MRQAYVSFPAHELVFSRNSHEYPGMMPSRSSLANVRLPRAVTMTVMFVAACSHSSTMAPTGHAPSDVAIAVPPEEPTPPLVAEPTPPVAPLPELAGDDLINEPWRTQFRRWLASQNDAVYTDVVSANEISNSVTLVLRHRMERDDQCFEGPNRLTLVSDPPSAEIENFGMDCCPGTECDRSPESWNLRYLNALNAKDWKTLALLIPSKGKLITSTTTIGSHLGPAAKKDRKFSRKDVAAGKFNGPGCTFVHTTPSCGFFDEKISSFTCKCDGGGYHVEYTWQKEGDDFVITRINEESH